MRSTSHPSPEPEHLRWVPSLRNSPRLRPDELALFCVPYAGGNASLYRPWCLPPPAGVRVLPVQLPGRMERLDERPLRSARELAAGVGQAVLASGSRRVALFGISLGSLVAFEAAHWLTDAGLAPEHLFVASGPGPSAPRPLTRHVHMGPDEELLDMVRALGVTPPELLADPEMRQLLLPVMRADFAVTETYTYERRVPLSSALTVLYGTKDPGLSPGAVDAWRSETGARFRVHRFPYGHFLLPAYARELLDLVRDSLTVPSRVD
ncbi:thioesterase II family protein [Streptomyces sp. NPDC055089]